MPARKKSPPPPLHELESEVMEAVWKRDRESTVRDILEALNRGSKKRAYTTVMTVLARLHRKGLLHRRRVARTDVYRPVMDRESYFSARADAEVSAVLAQYGDRALVRFSAELEKLDGDRLRELRRLARRG